MAWNPKYDIYKEFAMTPDRELLQWENWIKIRETEVIKLGFHLGRPPADLAMNQLEGVRPKKEQKITLEECQIPEKARNRGHIWEQAPRLYQRCPCENVYELHRTPAELGRPKIIEHIKCPEYIIKYEKCILGEQERVICSKLNAAYGQYRDEKAEKFKEKIKKIDPYRPDMKELIVIGKRPKPPPKKEKPLPVISIIHPTDPCRDVLSGVYALRLNNTIVIKQIPDQDVSVLRRMQREPWHENDCYSWTYYFNVPEKRMGRAKFYIENLGTVTLRYCWKKIKKMIPYIPEESYIQKFFFNKNEDVISPGQNKTISLTFISNKAGIYSETWEFALMNISLFDNLGDKFSINLVGDSVENMKKNARKIERLEKRIDRKSMSKFISDLLNDIFLNALSTKHEVYPYKKYFVEAELFVAINMQHFYHQTEVETLKTSYKQMTGVDWNLSLLSWRNAMMEKEFDSRMKYYEEFKNSHVILLRPWYEGDDLLTEKHRAVKLFLGKLADQFSFEFERVCEWNGIKKVEDPKAITPPLQESPLTQFVVHNIFYIRMYEHVKDTIETIAGILSSLDLNRWLQFDFCQT